MEEAKTCSWCGKTNVKPRCSLCKEQYYCDQKCQAQHWKAHKQLCPGYKPPRSINDFQLLEYVGFGNFSEILHVEEVRTQKQFALKKVNKQRVNQMRKQADVLMEKHALGRLQDLDGVVHLYECFKDETDLYFLTERIPGGELWEHCKFFGMPEPQARFYLKQVLATLIEVHKRGIVHRDLKTENIMVTPEGKTKLIDFGTAKDFEHPEVEVPGNSMRKKKFENFIGTPHFMAPECINNKDSNFKSDVWSLGCTLFFMLAGYPCFQGGSDYLIFTKSLKADYTFPDTFSEQAKAFITSCLQIEADSRPTMEELAAHEFVADAPTHFPTPTLEEVCVERLRTHLMSKFTEETAQDGLTEEFKQIYEVCGETALLRHTEDRLRYYFTKRENTNQQGI